MITIIFEAHATTVDNEADLASGWNDPELSEHGMREAREMGMRYAENAPAAVFLLRSGARQRPPGSLSEHRYR